MQNCTGRTWKMRADFALLLVASYDQFPELFRNVRRTVDYNNVDSCGYVGLKFSYLCFC
jgi:hypothetical protein